MDMHQEPDMTLLTRGARAKVSKVESALSGIGGYGFDLVVEPSSIDGSFSVESGRPAFVNFTHPLWPVLWRNLMLDSDVPEEIDWIVTATDQEYLDRLDEVTQYRSTVNALLHSTISPIEYEAIRLKLGEIARAYASHSRSRPLLSMDGAPDEPIELSILKYIFATYSFNGFESGKTGELLYRFRSITGREIPCVSSCPNDEEFASDFDRYLLTLLKMSFVCEPARSREWQSIFKQREVLVFVDRTSLKPQDMFSVDATAIDFCNVRRRSIRPAKYAIMIDEACPPPSTLVEQFIYCGDGLWILA